MIVYQMLAVDELSATVSAITARMAQSASDPSLTEEMAIHRACDGIDTGPLVQCFAWLCTLDLREERTRQHFTRAEVPHVRGARDAVLALLYHEITSRAQREA